jgi:hypothetical protein
MITAQEIKLETRQVVWKDETYPRPSEERTFAIFERHEDYLAFLQGVENKDSDWLDLDHTMFFAIAGWQGESLDDFTEDKDEDFFIIKKY